VSTPAPQKVAIITGASHGIGAGLVEGFRRSGYAVVGTARSIRRSDEAGYLTVEGDIAQAETADHVVEQALERFGRIDSLVNNAGIFIGKPFTDHTVDDYVAGWSPSLARWPSSMPHAACESTLSRSMPSQPHCMTRIRTRYWKPCTRSVG